MAKVSKQDIKPEVVNTTLHGRLPNEIQHEIIVHALNQSNPWSANETLSSISRTSWHLHNIAGSKAIRDYKENLDGGRLVSDAVVKTYFPKGNFSDSEIVWNRRNIWHETAAVAGALNFQSPEQRTKIFNNISAKPTEQRMVGYANIAEEASLFEKHQVAQMDRDALTTFREQDGSDFSGGAAAEVLAIRYLDVDPDVRLLIQQDVFNAANQEKRVQFSTAIVDRNPSLLEDDELRNIVRETYYYGQLEDPHGALAALAPYIDKTSLADTDFIVGESLRRIGHMTVLGEEHGRDAPARAIATVIDGEIRPQYRDEIDELRHSDSVEGRALAAALKLVERDGPPAIRLESGMSGTSKLLRQLETSITNPDHDDAKDGVVDVMRSNQKQIDAARENLLKSVRERNDRAR